MCFVAGAADDAAARKVARSVVSSSLAKAAVFGHDPNWGRIACAAGCALLCLTLLGYHQSVQSEHSSGRRAGWQAQS